MPRLMLTLNSISVAIWPLAGASAEPVTMAWPAMSPSLNCKAVNRLTVSLALAAIWMEVTLLLNAGMKASLAPITAATSCASRSAPFSTALRSLTKSASVALLPTPLVPSYGRLNTKASRDPLSSRLNFATCPAASPSLKSEIAARLIRATEPSGVAAAGMSLRCGRSPLSDRMALPEVNSTVSSPGPASTQTVFCTVGPTLI